MKRTMILILVSSFFWASCTGPETKTGKGALYGSGIGAATGAAAGQLLGRNTKSTVIGAAVGAAAGAALGAGVGHMMDKQEEEYRAALASSEAMAVRREGDLLAITLKGDLTFATDSAEVKPGLHREIDRIGAIMVQYPDTRIRVEGHTDSVGSEAYNQKLSERRAQSVVNLLIQRGVASSRIASIGFGENSPVATNDTPEGRQLNRRVEIRIDPAMSGPS